MLALVIQHVELEGPGLLGEMFDRMGWQMDVRHMNRPGVSLPGELEKHDGLVIMGGPMGADDEASYPYLAEVKALVRLAAQMSIPTVGVCLGGQLIARALGAKVWANAVTEIGWHLLRLTPAGRQSPLFSGLPEVFPVFQWHNDTFDIPPGASHLAASPLCGHQAFVYREHVWGLQFHLEVTPEIVVEWAEAGIAELAQVMGRDAPEDILKAHTNQLWPQQQAYCRRFLDNLGNLMQEAAAGRL